MKWLYILGVISCGLLFVLFMITAIAGIVYFYPKYSAATISMTSLFGFISLYGATLCLERIVELKNDHEK